MLTKKLRNTKLFGMIQESQSKKAEMNELKETKSVRRFIELDDERRKLHREISNHVEQYGVNVEEYKPAGLVERDSRWVTVSDIEQAAKDQPELKDFLLSMINKKTSHYTREV